MKLDYFLGIRRVTAASRGSSCYRHNSSMCKCHAPQRQRVKKSTCSPDYVAQMQKPQALQVLAGREDIKQDDYEGLILFSSPELHAL